MSLHQLRCSERKKHEIATNTSDKDRVALTEEVQSGAAAVLCERKLHGHCETCSLEPHRVSPT